jgi:hypothetical protein
MKDGSPLWFAAQWGYINRAGKNLNARKMTNTDKIYFRARVISFCLVACLSSASVSGAAAQDGLKKLKKDVLPRIGTIKDYPATGLMTGCSNLYFMLPKDGASLAQKYVFLARGNGADAWMNLGGRDIRLKQINSARRPNKIPVRYNYRWRKVSVNVVIRDFKPRRKTDNADEFMFAMTITLRKGRAVKTLRAVGSADC